MTEYAKQIILDVDAINNYTIIKAKQGDSINRKIAITLMREGEYFAISDYTKIQFRCEKPDGSIVVISNTDAGSPISVSGNTYTVSLSSQCLSVAGEAFCDIAFYSSSNNIISSATFVLDIIPMPNIASKVESSDDWAELQKAIDDAERFANILDFRVSAGYIQFTVDGTTWENLCALSDVVGTLTAGDVTYNDSVNYENGTVGKKLNDISGDISEINNSLDDFAPIISPVFQGTPESVTPPQNDNSTKIATTAFVKALISAIPSYTAENVMYDSTLESHESGSVGEKLKSLEDDLSETVPISRGGTGATTVSAAKVALGLDQIGFGSIAVPKQATTDIRIPNNSLGVIFLSGSGGVIVIVSCSSAAAGSVVSYTQIGETDVYTFTTDANKLSVANASTANLLAMWMEFSNKPFSLF